MSIFALWFHSIRHSESQCINVCRRYGFQANATAHSLNFFRYWFYSLSISVYLASAWQKSSTTRISYYCLYWFLKNFEWKTKVSYIRLIDKTSFIVVDGSTAIIIALASTSPYMSWFYEFDLKSSGKKMVCSIEFSRII